MKKTFGVMLFLMMGIIMLLLPIVTAYSSNLLFENILTKPIIEGKEAASVLSLK